MLPVILTDVGLATMLVGIVGTVVAAPPEYVRPHPPTRDDFLSRRGPWSQFRLP